MPYTVNGIGTTYFGTWNRQVQDGICDSCHQHVKLVNYETWHCICVIFIPIIPLGKKQVLDYCPSCSRHRVLSFREWVKIRDEAIGETATQFSASPDDPDAAVQMHATLSAFQKRDEAAQLAEMLETKFPDVARVQFYLAAWYEQSGKPEVANRLFMRAFELDPDDLGIRRAAMLTFVEQGEVDKAKTLIQPYLPGTENFDAGLFYALATGFQKAGRHQEAVQTLRMLLDAAPTLKTDKTFRKALAISEKSLGVDAPTIPPDPFYKSGLFLGSIASLAVVAALMVWNFQIASNRTVTVVNGLKAPITVNLDDRSPLEIPAGNHVDVKLAEGQHAAEVSKPANQYPKTEFVVSTNWWERFFRRPAFVVDPTKSAAVVFEEVTYSRAEGGAKPPDGRREMRLGEPFSSYNHIDYRFVNFPATIQLGRKTRRVVKTRVAVTHEDVEDLVMQAQSEGKSPESMLPFLEAHLQVPPDNSQLLAIYGAWSQQANKTSQCRDFLRTRLSDRPVRVDWHRTYQAVSISQGDLAVAQEQQRQLKQEYDTILEAEPEDPSLIYLRGRLENHTSQAMPYFDRALAVSQKHPYALYAKGYCHLTRGEFDVALDLMKQATASSNEPTFQLGLRGTQFATGDLEGLEKYARAELASSPLNPSALLILLKTLVASNRADEADRELVRFTTQIQQHNAIPLQSVLEPLTLLLSSFKGDFTEGGKFANSPNGFAQRFGFFASLENNQLADLPADAPAKDAAYWSLCREFVARKSADAEQAKAARTTALSYLDAGSDEDWAAADVLRRSENVTWDEIEDLFSEPDHKAVVLVALAHDRADLRPQLLGLAEKLNFDLEFPHYLLQREIADLRQKE
jgi:tetratricopeptide (TPR) repeat protein